MFKLIVAGGRNFSDQLFMNMVLDKILSNKIPNVEIVSGCAKGADNCGEYYASSNGLSIKRFPANWVQYGKAAGPKRNEEMAKYADACVCFWDGKSKGTMSMINMAKKYNIQLRVIKY